MLFFSGSDYDLPPDDDDGTDGLQRRCWISSQSIDRFGSAEARQRGRHLALATVPMIGFVGAAVDYSRANSAKAAMQSAANSPR